MDVLDQLVQFAQISGGVNVQCRFQGEWFVRHEKRMNQAVVHIVVAGSGYLKVAGESKSRLLQQGDILFFSRSAEHILSHDNGCDTPYSLPTQYHQGQFQIKQTGQGECDLQLFCAHFDYDKRADLFNNLPEWFSLNLPEHQLQPIVRLLEQEVELPSFGSQRVVDSLSQVLLIAIIRAYLAQRPAELGGILNAVQDIRLSTLIHQIVLSPEEAWSVERMLVQVPISRAQLMRLFKQRLGDSPHAFVNKIRLQKAAVQLKQSADSILTIALACGFQSETHFGKSFKKQYDVTPSSYRKQQRIIHTNERGKHME